MGCVGVLCVRVLCATERVGAGVARTSNRAKAGYSRLRTTSTILALRVPPVGKLLKNLTEGMARAAWLRLSAKAGQAGDLVRIGDLRQRFSP